jgi:hypothetical protein
MKKKVYIITGAPNVRKSSVIRALTGIRDTKTFEIQFEEGVLKTHVMATSPNELSIESYRTGMTTQQLIDYLNNLIEGEQAVILPLRSVEPKFNLPLASEYIQALINAGFEIAQVIMFNVAVPLPHGVQGIDIESNRNVPSNCTASKLREFWGII